MKRTLLYLALICGAMAASVATAQTDPALYKALGENAGITSLTVDFVARLKADTRFGDMFKKTNSQNLSDRLAEQFCVLSGGSCKYTGADMKSAHSSLDITKGNFNALVEDLQAAMDAKNIPFAAQNQLLAKLAPMHRDIITQ
jgi:hemoglobin